MLVRIDILDDRLEAIEADDDRERLRAHLAMWRDGEVDPLRDEGVILVVEAGGPPIVANDGSGDADANPAPGAGRHGRRGRGRTRH